MNTKQAFKKQTEYSLLYIDPTLATDSKEGNSDILGNTKGQLISKGNFGVFKSTKKQRNFCKDFCPNLVFMYIITLMLNT